MDRCLICDSADICGCKYRWTLPVLRAKLSAHLADLLRDCYTGPLPEEKKLRQIICLILLERETSTVL